MGTDNLFHKRKERNARPLHRRRVTRYPYDIVLIVCEGGKQATSRAYPATSQKVMEQQVFSTAPVLHIFRKRFAPSIIEKLPIGGGDRLLDRCAPWADNA